MIDWDSSPTLEAVSHLNASPGFSKFHAKLLDICFGHYHPEADQVQEVSGETLDYPDLERLAYMVLVEFACSVEKEYKGTQDETHVKTEPHPYDVFVMKTTFGAQTSNVSVVLPIKGQLLWWDGDKGVETLHSDIHVYRIASLSGPARVLECLYRAGRTGESLSRWAMRREMLVGIADDPSTLASFSRLIFGTAAPVQSSIVDSLNESQRQAVTAVVSTSFQEGFFAIQGPPGCGKTTTMVSMISAIRGDMIVTAPSNAAVANLAIKLFDTGRFVFGNVCVFGEGCDKSVRFLNPRHRSDEYKNALEEYMDIEDNTEIPPGPDAAEKKKKRESQKGAVRQKFAQWLHVDEGLTMTQLHSLCPNIEVDGISNSVTREGRRVIAQIMGNANVVLCTLNSSGSSYLQNAVSTGRFQTFLLDEGGQCTEAEFFIAATFPGVKRIIVMGDPNQLRPTVLEPTCSRAGFGESWLGRVYKLHPSKVHLLDTQYRMDPVILKFPNRRFYGLRIKSGENVLHRSPPVAKPFRLIDTHGRGREERDENFSYRNAYEIAVIRDILKTDPDIAAIVRDNGHARIIIITPYKAQAKLLQEMARSLKYMNLAISTVDAFQGQEGDIVILSTVRTRSAGFVDDAQRLNVALTRAKRVLRVVGDRTFFANLRPGSTLRALAMYAEKTENVGETKLRSLPWCPPPDLSIQTQWKMTLTQRFHNVLRLLPLSGKHVALNTLFAIALPDLDALGNRVVEKDGWHTSWLKGCPGTRVIWVARNQEGVKIVEAHYGGTLEECLHFRQVNHVAPDGCCAPRSDMCEVVKEDLSPPENGRLFVSWPLDSHLQNAILSDRLQDLPLSMIQLDPLQEKIARSPPPLLIESRSGTGKTLVLLQHAAFYCRTSDSRPACFITVSPRLKNELEQKYEELTPIHGAGLPKTKFFTFRDFITGLLSHYKILDFEDKDKCTFQGYIQSRRSHGRVLIEAHLLENEIGGVIMGSVAAAQRGAALTREQYAIDKRSNIPNKTREGREQRNVVFDEYERYKEWKNTGGKYDIHDTVLRLLTEKPQQLFASAYLDEVQDLSHAAIFLICGLAGRDEHYWVCGGDPAQMISPGCSFTFDGLKQTLLTLESGIEKKIKQVEHLLVNYRTTKDILTLGNEILSTAKQFFPGAIDFAQPERARKDLGLKVVVCSWRVAFEARAKFGDNQAFIFSTNNPNELVPDARKWLDNHPFILSSLDSKGLEFDDVVVAFDHDRKVWQVENKREATLGMLRELYVAVTRAQRRVVILVKDDIPAMQSFFENLNCDVENSDGRIFEEFNCDTSTEEWFERAQKLFRNYQFKFAASCFTRAKRQDWSFLAQGRDLLESGLPEEAAIEFRRAARGFYEGRDFEQILGILCRLLGLGSWDGSDDKIFMDALEALPNSIPRAEAVRYAILRQEFSSVLTNDLKDHDVCKLLMEYRHQGWLKKLIVDCTETDREAIGSSMPVVVVDYHINCCDFHQACRVALDANKCQYADTATVALLEQVKREYNASSILKMVDIWEEFGPKEPSRVLPPTSPSALLCQIFKSPRQVPSSLKSECASILGKDIVMLAVDRFNLDRTVLLDFSTTMFKPEVDAVLMAQCGPYHIDVVRWYDRNHPALASQYVQERLNDWSDDDMFRIAMCLLSRPQWLFQELKRRQLLYASKVLILLSPFVGEESKKQFLKSYLTFGGVQEGQQLENDKLQLVKDKCERDLESVLAQLTASWQLFEKSFLFLKHDIKTAIHYSWVAVETHELASLNITRLLSLWTEIQHDRESHLPLFEDKYSLLMCLFFGDEPTESSRRFLLGEQHHFASLLLVFGPTAAAYCKMHMTTTTTNPSSQDDALRQRIREFHKELKAHLRSRHPQTAPGVQDSDVGNQASRGIPTEIEGPNDAKPLSKKAARQQKKKQTKQKETQGNSQVANSKDAGNASKKKRKNNNKKKNKKKGGKR